MPPPNSAVALFDNVDAIKSSYAVKAGIVQMLRGGVVIEVSSPEAARVAEEAGAVAVLVVDPDDDDGYDYDDVANARRAAGVARMVDPDLIKSIRKATTLPVMAKARIGHFVEAQLLEHLGVDFIDESESLTCADHLNFINKHDFSVPFMCGCSNLGEALRRMAEGASMIRTQGHEHHHDCTSDIGDCSECRETSSWYKNKRGNVMHVVKQLRSILSCVRSLQGLQIEELHGFAKKIRVPYELLKLTKQLGRLPIMLFAYGGMSTPADAAMAMQLGCDGIILNSHIFERTADPLRKARAFVQAVSNYNDSQILAELCTEYKMEEVMRQEAPIVIKKDSGDPSAIVVENIPDQMEKPIGNHDLDSAEQVEGVVGSVDQLSAERQDDEASSSKVVLEREDAEDSEAKNSDEDSEAKNSEEDSEAKNSERQAFVLEINSDYEEMNSDGGDFLSEEKTHDHLSSTRIVLTPKDDKNVDEKTSEEQEKMDDLDAGNQKYS